MKKWRRSRKAASTVVGSFAAGSKTGPWYRTQLTPTRASRLRARLRLNEGHVHG